MIKRQEKNKHTIKFIDHVNAHLAEHGFSLVWGRGKGVQCGGYTSAAYFSEIEKVIKVARKNKSWLECLVHEYSHFLQFINKSKLYRNSDFAIMEIDRWFNREKISKTRLNRIRDHFNVVREMERECEIIACRVAKKHKLPINRKGYAKRANIYIYSHWIMEQKQKFWAFKRDPLDSKYILSLVPSNFRVHAHKKIPQKIKKALEGYLH